MGAAMGACGRGGALPQAHSLLRDMQKRIYPNSVTFNEAIQSCELAGDWTLALALFCEMRQRKLKRNMASYTLVISACEKDGALGPALDLLDDMEDSFFEPNVITYTALISTCAKASSPDVAQILWKRM